MTAADERARIREAVTAVRHCANTMESQAASLLDALPNVKMDAELRTSAAELSSSLKDTAARVNFELALLAAQVGATDADVAEVTQRLIELDATMMGAVAPVAELADRLEAAAERDDGHERAFVLVIEAAGALLQGFKKANAATAALQQPQRIM